MHANTSNKAHAFLERLRKKPSSRDLRRPLIPPSDLNSPDGTDLTGRYDTTVQAMLREESRRLKDELMDVMRGATVAESKPLPGLPTHSIGTQTEPQPPLKLVPFVGESGIAPVEPSVVAKSLAFVNRVGTMEIIPTEPPAGTKQPTLVPCVGQMEILPLTSAMDTKDLSNSPRPNVTSSYLSVSECQEPCPLNLAPHQQKESSAKKPTSSRLRDATAPSSSERGNPWKKKIKIPWRGKNILVKLPDVSPSEYKASKPWIFSRPSGSEPPGQDAANPSNTPPENSGRDDEAPATPLPIERQPLFPRLREQPAHPFPFRPPSSRLEDVVFHFGLEPPGGFQGMPGSPTRSALLQPVTDLEHEDAWDKKYEDAPLLKERCSQLGLGRRGNYRLTS